MRAIETRYKGHRFRSRLEARWAVFFDALGVQWDYEPEGYQLDNAGWYLPDFYLPNIRGGVWIEVKADRRQDETDAAQAIADLVEATGKAGMVVFGDPMTMVERVEEYGGAPYGESPGEDSYGYWMFELSQHGLVSDGLYLFCVCPVCSRAGLEFDGRGARVCGDRCNPDDDKAYTGSHPKIYDAAERARSARFEHGEAP